MTQLAEHAAMEARRQQVYAARLATLIQVEEDKIDMYADVLRRVRLRVEGIQGIQDFRFRVNW